MTSKCDPASSQSIGQDCAVLTSTFAHSESMGELIRPSRLQPQSGTQLPPLKVESRAAQRSAPASSSADRQASRHSTASSAPSRSQFSKHRSVWISMLTSPENDVHHSRSLTSCSQYSRRTPSSHPASGSRSRSKPAARSCWRTIGTTSIMKRGVSVSTERSLRTQHPWVVNIKRIGGYPLNRSRLRG